jgi:hypothetical protein
MMTSTLTRNDGSGLAIKATGSISAGEKTSSSNSTVRYGMEQRPHPKLLGRKRPLLAIEQQRARAPTVLSAGANGSLLVRRRIGQSTTEYMNFAE